MPQDLNGLKELIASNSNGKRKYLSNVSKALCKSLSYTSDEFRAEYFRETKSISLCVFKRLTTGFGIIVGHEGPWTEYLMSGVSLVNHSVKYERINNSYDHCEKTLDLDYDEKLEYIGKAIDIVKAKLDKTPIKKDIKNKIEQDIFVCCEYAILKYYGDIMMKVHK